MSTEEIIAQTAVAVIAATDPKAAAVAALVPGAIDLVQQAISMESVGVIDPATLASLFANVSQSIKAKHEAWLSLNAQ